MRNVTSTDNAGLLAGAALLAAAPRRRRAGHLHDRRLQHRAGQWLARGNDLLDQGAGAGLGQGRHAQHRAPQHRCGRPARRHPQPDQRQGQRDRRQPGRSGRHPGGARGSHRGRHRRRRRRPERSPSRSAYIISNNQEQYAYLGAKWLFEQMGGKGNVVYMRGAAGASADSDRDKGFKKALAEFPDVKVAQETFTGWQQDQGKQQILDYIATGVPFDGIWTSGIDNVIVDALVEVRRTAGAGRRRRQCRLRRPAQLGRRPQGRGGHQPRLDRRRRRDARAADPRRQEAGRSRPCWSSPRCGKT